MGETYKYVVIGSGPAGYVSAIKASQEGIKTLVVEKNSNHLGGVCLNQGCIPAKSLYNSAKLYKDLLDNKKLFNLGDSFVAPDISQFVDKSRLSSEHLKKGLRYLLKKNNVDILEGEAFFEDEKNIRVKSDGGESILKSENFLVASGSSVRNLPGLTVDNERIITSRDAILLKKIPPKLLIIGAGAVGTEFAAYFNTLGSQVTLAEFKSSILPFEDPEASRILSRVLKKNGIKIKTGVKFQQAEINCDSVKVRFEGSEENEEDFTHVLVAVGRISNTDSLFLSDAGVCVDKNGFIEVNEKLQSTNPRVYAAGDVVRTPMLAHAAYAEGELAANMVAGVDSEVIDYKCCPNVTYTPVQLASVGLTEKEVLEEGIEYVAGKSFFRSNGKAVISSGIEGFVKILAEKVSGRILGAHIVNENAGELIHEFVLAKKNDLSVGQIEKTIHAHPTLSESICEAARSISSRPLHGDSVT